LRLTTSIVGIVVLVISLDFLPIFVQQVYQIKALDLQPRSSAAPAQGTARPAS
jgi:hypothetical protein